MWQAQTRPEPQAPLVVAVARAVGSHVEGAVALAQEVFASALVVASEQEAVAFAVDAALATAGLGRAHGLQSERVQWERDVVTDWEIMDYIRIRFHVQFHDPLPLPRRFHDHSGLHGHWEDTHSWATADPLGAKVALQWKWRQ